MSRPPASLPDRKYAVSQTYHDDAAAVEDVSQTSHDVGRISAAAAAAAAPGCWTRTRICAGFSTVDPHHLGLLSMRHPPARQVVVKTRSLTSWLARDGTTKRKGTRRFGRRAADRQIRQHTTARSLKTPQPIRNSFRRCASLSLPTALLLWYQLPASGRKCPAPSGQHQCRKSSPTIIAAPETFLGLRLFSR